MQPRTLEDIRRRRASTRDAIAQALHDESTGRSWQAESDEAKKHWYQLAGLALEVVDRYDNGLIEWLADCESARRDQLQEAASKAKDLLDCLQAPIPWRARTGG